jgi:hypothetical protein
MRRRGAHPLDPADLGSLHPSTIVTILNRLVLRKLFAYDAESGKYRSHFFDSQGHVTVDELLYEDGAWIWKGERIRTTSTFSADGKVQRFLHEQTDDGVEWRPAMDVTLRRID